MPQEGHTYGPQTQALVQDFQRRAGINPSGIVGPKTWDALYKVVSVTGMWGC
ncbi:peptidoglycan-binding domain-containing protein [Kibdelosporangium phytohabitans]|uniref:peptidoglycan-binding domain-containing protein n=1 Tax=Kibdelosporangium phytohabitans TaxID=860235 RepID=UPI002FF57021